MDSDETRWKQRFRQFEKASQLLFEAAEKPLSELNELERDGMIQRFEYTFELMWKVLKDLLFYEGFDVKSPREVLRQAFVSEYLNEDDTETALDALNKRNLLSHTYEEAIAIEAIMQIKNNYVPMLKQFCNTLKEKK